MAQDIDISIDNTEDVDVELDGVTVSAIQQVQSDWSEIDAESPAFIKNKPTIPQTAADVGAFPITGGTVTGTVTALELRSGDVVVVNSINGDSIHLENDSPDDAEVSVLSLYGNNDGEVRLRHIAPPDHYTDAANKKYVDDSVDGLASETWVQNQGYLVATAGSAPTGTEMQNVYKDTDGNLVTASGGGGSVQEVFFAQYGSTALSDIVTAHNSGKEIICIYENKQYQFGGFSSDVSRAFFSSYIDRLIRLSCTTNGWTQLSDQYFLTDVPQATDAALGGIKAAARDASTDTQEVKIGTDGKLYATEFVVSFTDGETLTADKSFAEIRAAVQNGQKIIAKYSYFGLPLSGSYAGGSSTAVVFSFSVYGTFVWLRISSTNSIAKNIKDIVFSVGAESSDAGIPTALAVKTYADNAISTAIGDTAGALSDLDSLIGGGAE